MGGLAQRLGAQVRAAGEQQAVEVMEYVVGLLLVGYVADVEGAAAGGLDGVGVVGAGRCGVVEYDGCNGDVGLVHGWNATFRVELAFFACDHCTRAATDMQAKKLRPAKITMLTGFRDFGRF